MNDAFIFWLFGLMCFVLAGWFLADLVKAIAEGIEKRVDKAKPK